MRPRANGGVTAVIVSDVSRGGLGWQLGPGETTISWSAFWDGDLNGPAAGGGDDVELTIASVQFSQADQEYTVWGGNDSGVDHTLTLQVQCLAA